MDVPTPKEPPAAERTVVGLMICAGFCSLLLAIPVGLAFSCLACGGWGLSWAAILGATLTTGIALTGGFILLVVVAIYRFWPDVYFESTAKDPRPRKSDA